MQLGLTEPKGSESEWGHPLSGSEEPWVAPSVMFVQYPPRFVGGPILLRPFDRGIGRTYRSRGFGEAEPED